MITAFLSLAIVLLFVKLVAFLINLFLRWLGSGKAIRYATKDERLEAEYAEELKAFVKECEHIKQESSFKLFRRRKHHLSKELKAKLREVDRVLREEYLNAVKLSWYQIIVIFLVGSFLGLLLEETWMFVTEGLTQSRVGLVWGPFSPLYGFGASFLTIVMWNLRKKRAKDWQVFVVSVVIGGGLEQTTGWTMLHVFNMESWTYSHLPDAISQWVAVRFLVFWGILGVVWYKSIMPDILFRIGMPTTKRQVIFVALIALYLALDIFMTMSCFIRMKQRDEGIPPQNAFESWIDEHYSNAFIAERFQNLIVNPPAQDTQDTTK